MRPPAVGFIGSSGATPVLPPAAFGTKTLSEGRHSDAAPGSPPPQSRDFGPRPIEAPQQLRRGFGE
jgi:hypothetical protein